MILEHGKVGTTHPKLPYSQSVCLIPFYARFLNAAINYCWGIKGSFNFKYNSRKYWIEFPLHLHKNNFVVVLNNYEKSGSNGFQIGECG